MKRFFREKYYSSATHPKNNSVIRNVTRGFNPFISDALESVDNLTRDREQQLSLCELGIGGGGAHAMLQSYTQDSHILGVDLFHIDHLESYKNNGGNDYYIKEFDRYAKDYINSKEHINKLWTQIEDYPDRLEIDAYTPNKKPSLFHGMDAYNKSTAEHLVSVNGAKLDYVNDDASPDGGALNGLMDAYKDSISDEGILISTGPFGNGTEQAYNRWESGEYLKDIDVLVKQGFVIFDMTEYRHIHLDWDKVTYVLSYLAMWAPDFNNYDNLLKKYEHNIINGKDNWKT